VGSRRPPRDEDEVFGAAQYTKARAVREHYQARLAKLEYEEKVASLVSKDEVQVATFNTFRQYRDGMLNIPDW
jgi:formaldehyde-activating enzyme involved in methanogenesis